MGAVVGRGVAHDAGQGTAADHGDVRRDVRRSHRLVVPTFRLWLLGRTARRYGLLDLPAFMLPGLVFNCLIAYTSWYYWLV